jgi:peroxiredoxin Q/BCP
MAQLRHDYQEFIIRQVQVVVVGPDSPEAFKGYWEKNDLPFTGLPDPKASVLKLFGQEVKIFKYGRLPAQVIVDKHGIARYVHYGHSMADIPDNKELLDIFDQLNKE